MKCEIQPFNPEINWKFWPELIALLERVSFPCNFKDDSCANGPMKKRGQEYKTCCCIGCKDYYGFLREIYAKTQEEYDKNLEIIRSLFDENLGFWRSGKGCVLPRLLRSKACNSYSCQEIRNTMKPGLELLLNLLDWRNGAIGKIMNMESIKQLEQFLIEEGSIR